MSKGWLIHVIAAAALLGHVSALRADEPAAKPAATQPVLVMLDRHIIEQTKQRIAANDPSVMPAFESLKKRADAALKQKTFKTVMDKPAAPPSGDKHDFMSLSPYVWPDPNTPDGKPWVYRDGERNDAEVKKWDNPPYWVAMQTIRATACMYALTGDAKYADKAATLLRLWFLDPATRMNPSHNFGEFIPGKKDGTKSGVLDTRDIVFIAFDPATLLEGSNAWTAADRDGLHQWANEYLKWLTESPLGKAEGESTNNHGVWYDAQVASIARYVGRDDLARQILTAFGDKRLSKQIEPDGSMPRELARTRSFHYDVFMLRAAQYVAHMGMDMGVDIYHYESSDGRSLRKAIDYLLPYLTKEKPWDHQELVPDQVDTLLLRPLLRDAAKAYGDEKYNLAADKLFGPKPGNERADNLFGVVTDW